MVNGGVDPKIRRGVLCLIWDEMFSCNHLSFETAVNHSI